MKQIINGKLHDTDNAEYMASITEDDINKMDIYRTKKGTYFGYDRNSQGLIDEKMLKVYLGYKNPEYYMELFGEVEEA